MLVTPALLCARARATTGAASLLVARRLDVVAVISSAVNLKVTSELGLRSVAKQLDVPHTTVRSRWQRFRQRSASKWMSVVTTPLPQRVSIGWSARPDQVSRTSCPSRYAVAWRPRSPSRSTRSSSRAWTAEMTWLGLQIDRTRRRTTRALLGYPLSRSIRADRTEDSLRRLSLVLLI